MVQARVKTIIASYTKPFVYYMVNYLENFVKKNITHHHQKDFVEILRLRLLGVKLILMEGS